MKIQICRIKIHISKNIWQDCEAYLQPLMFKSDSLVLVENKSPQLTLEFIILFFTYFINGFCRNKNTIIHEIKGTR